MPVYVQKEEGKVADVPPVAGEREKVAKQQRHGLRWATSLPEGDWMTRGIFEGKFSDAVAVNNAQPHPRRPTCFIVNESQWPREFRMVKCSNGTKYGTTVTLYDPSNFNEDMTGKLIVGVHSCDHGFTFEQMLEQRRG